jgi:hypothetical protein
MKKQIIDVWVEGQSNGSGGAKEDCRSFWKRL